MNQQSMFIPVGTILKGKYRIDKHLASGGFGKTYLAFNLEMESMVVVKEFFMQGVNVRNTNATTVGVGVTENQGLFNSQREKFKKEAQRLWSLKSDHIVQVHDLFDENDTSYYVMDYIDGESLDERLKRQGSPIFEDRVLDIALQVLDALRLIHANRLWHMDLKPGNIMEDHEGRCRLIDFGSSKQTGFSGSNTSTALTYTPGYAPSEQINGTQAFWGPWTDLYSLGAMLYNLLTCNKPPQRDEIDVRGDAAFIYVRPVSERTKALVRWLMQPIYTHRPQSADAVIAYIRCYGGSLGNTPFAGNMGNYGVPFPSAPSVSPVPPVNSEPPLYSQQTLDEGNSVSLETSDKLVEQGDAMSVDESPMAMGQRAVVRPQPPADHSTRPSSNLHRVMWFLAGFFFVILCVGGFFLLRSCDSNKKAPNSTPTVKKVETPQDSIPLDLSAPRSFTVKGVEFKMMPVEGGTFTMGATSEQAGSPDIADEYPTHQVTLSSYMIGETEVTQELWVAVMGYNPSQYQKDLQCPVHNVNWNDCRQFIAKLNSLTGKKFRLPTEAEWEFAARGGNKSSGYKLSGDNNLYKVAWCKDNSNGKVHPVANLNPNELAIYDMSGNVWEWIDDFYAKYTGNAQTNPNQQSTAQSSAHVVRGGGINGYERNCRVTNRDSREVSYNSDRLGFRLALSE